MSLAIFHPHFVIRIFPSTFYHPHFSIRILSSAFFYPPSAIRHPPSAIRHPPSAAIRSVLYRDPTRDIEKKLDVVHILNGILAKTRNLFFLKKKKTVWLSCQSINSIRCCEAPPPPPPPPPPPDFTLRAVGFSKKMHHIINSCTNMSKIFGNKVAKRCTP